MTSGIPYDSRRGPRHRRGALTAIMTGVSYATSAEMAGELGPFPGYKPNADAHAARHPQPPPRRPWRDRRLRGLCRRARRRSTTPRCHDGETARIWRTPRAAWDRALELGEKHGYRNAQATVDRADRHDRPRHGLRHHRHRARLRAGEVQEARRRRLLQDHQPRRAGGAARARLPARPRSPRSRPMRSATAPGAGARRQPRARCARAASPTRRSPRWRRRSPSRLRHQVRLQQVDARRGLPDRHAEGAGREAGRPLLRAAALPRLLARPRSRPPTSMSAAR